VGIRALAANVNSSNLKLWRQTLEHTTTRQPTTSGAMRPLESLAWLVRPARRWLRTDHYVSLNAR